MSIVLIIITNRSNIRKVRAFFRNSDSWALTSFWLITYWIDFVVIQYQQRFNNKIKQETWDMYLMHCLTIREHSSVTSALSVRPPSPPLRCRTWPHSVRILCWGPFLLPFMAVLWLKFIIKLKNNALLHPDFYWPLNLVVNHNPVPP